MEVAIFLEQTVTMSLFDATAANIYSTVLEDNNGPTPFIDLKFFLIDGAGNTVDEISKF